MDKRVLVTGGTGCVGANLVRHLNGRGLRPRVLMRKTSKTLAIADLNWEPAWGDVNDPSSIAEAVRGCDWVFHVAGIVSFWRKRWDEVMRVNIDGTRNVLEASKRAGVEKFVFTSSTAAIGYCENPDTFVNEDSPWNYEPYGLVYHTSKRRSEELVLKASNEDFHTFAVNPGLIFGERDVNLSAARIIKLIARYRLTFVSKGGVTISDADDVAEGHILAAERGRPSERYVIASGTICLMDLYTTIGQIIGKKTRPHKIPKWAVFAAAYIGEAVGAITRKEPYLTYDLAVEGNLHQYASSAKAQRELGYKPTPLQTSLEKSYKWLVDHGII